MKRGWYALLLLSTLVSGCHVVERAERCGRLADIVKKAAPEIEKASIADSPSAKSLRNKSRLYGQLAENLGKVHFKDQQAKIELQSLIGSFLSLERHLLEAALAVEAQDKFVERQSRMTARHEEILSQKAAYAAKMESSAPKPAAPGAATSSEKKGAPLIPRGLPGLVARTRSIPPAGTVAPPPSSARFSPHTYSYDRAKRAAESATRAVETARRNLESVCR